MFYPPALASRSQPVLRYWLHVQLCNSTSASKRGLDNDVYLQSLGHRRRRLPGLSAAGLRPREAQPQRLVLRLRHHPALQQESMVRNSVSRFVDMMQDCSRSGWCCASGPAAENHSYVAVCLAVWTSPAMKLQPKWRCAKALAAMLAQLQHTMVHRRNSIVQAAALDACLKV